MGTPKLTAIYIFDGLTAPDLLRYEPTEMVECFAPAERDALARGEVITRGGCRYVSATALALRALGA